MSQARRCKTAAELLGVMDTPKTGRGRLIITAIDLFYTHGFNAVGLDRILAEAGVTKTTFYKHFESKDELVVEAVKVRDQWEQEAWTRAVEARAGGDPRAELLAVFEVLDEWFNAPDFGGCMFINAAAEFPNPADPVHQAAAAHKTAFRDWITQLAREAGATEVDVFVDQYVLIFEGSLIMRQVHGRDDAARLARNTIGQLLGHDLPENSA